MPKCDRLRLKDVRAVFHLLGECCELGRDPRDWRRHMLQGLRALTGAQVALYLQLHHIGTDEERIEAPLDAGFLDGSERALWAHYQTEKAHRSDPFHLSYYRDFTTGLRTRRLESVVDMLTWRRSRHYNEYIRACRLDDRITSSLQRDAMPPGAVQVIVLHRSAHDGLFAPRASRIVHLFHDELSRLIGRKLSTRADPETDRLPSQLEQVLSHLLRGTAEKQIAHALGISPHTVNRHVQRLYQRFGVHSRGELMFQCRDMLSSGLAAPVTPHDG